MTSPFKFSCSVLGRGGWPARRKIMRFMEWMDQGRGAAWKQEALPTTSLPTTR